MKSKSVIDRIAFGVFAVTLAVSPASFGQQQQQLIQPGATVQPPASQNQFPEANSVRPDYVLGPNDQILIRAPKAEEIDQRPFRVDADGNISLPLVGKVHASGMTIQNLEPVLNQKLGEYIRDPQVFVTVVQFRSEPVFVNGDFRAPGIYPLQGRTLVEMLTVVGGLQPTASRRIRITRRSEYGMIPLPNVIADPEKRTNTVEISMRSLMEDVNPAEDIKLQPYDIISAARAERVYVSGEVAKPGPVELGERETVPITEALTEVGGTTNYAIKDRVRILRPILNTSRRAEIDIDLRRVLEGKELDFPLLPGDQVYVARNGKRAALGPAGAVFLGSIPYMIIALAVGL